MNAREELQLENTFGSGLGATYTDAELAIRASQANTNWADVFFGTGVTQNHTLSLTSGGENLSSFTSFGYFDQEGILKKASDLKRFNIRNNLNGKSKDDRFNYSTSISLNYSESNEPNSIGSGAINRNFVLGAYQSVPYLSPEQYTRGEGASIPVLFRNTPLFLLDRRDTYVRREDEIKILGNINGSYKITDNLTFASSFGIDFTDEQLLRVEAPGSFNAQLFAEDGNTTPGFSDQDVTRTLALNFNNSLTYRKTFAEKHTIEVSAATEYFKAHLRSFGFRQEGFAPQTFYPGDGASFVDDNADNDFFVDTGRANVQNAGLFSYFAFADYDYNETYGFSATIRRDASYRFKDDNKWGTFYSVAGRWTISNEKFMQDGPFDLLKIRGSYGTTGNQRIVDAVGQFAYFSGPDLTEDLFGTGTAYGGANGLSVAQLGNTDLRWETIVQTNIGLDFELLNRRLRGNIDVYKKVTEDLFLAQNISPALNGGITSINSNIGELENTGVDVTLRYDLLKSNDGLNLTLNLAGNYNKQEITDLGESGTQALGLVQNRVGGPINEAFLISYAGVNPANGNLLFYDIDGNVTENPTNADRRNSGKNIYPDYQGSFGFDADYKGFFLTTQFNFVVGVDTFDFDYSGFIDPQAIGQFRHSRDILRAWTPDNRVTDIPSLNATNLNVTGNSDRFYKEADYLRLRFFQFGYAVPQKFLKDTGLTSVKAFVNGENLVTFSKWRGFDAEVITSAQNNYPTPKIFSVGLEVGF